jgi:hypothetical protein
MLAHNVGMATEWPISCDCCPRSMSAKLMPTQVERLRRLVPMTRYQPRFLWASLFILVLQQAKQVSSSVETPCSRTIGGVNRISFAASGTESPSHILPAVSTS